MKMILLKYVIMVILTCYVKSLPLNNFSNLSENSGTDYFNFESKKTNLTEYSIQSTNDEKEKYISEKKSNNPNSTNFVKTSAENYSTIHIPSNWHVTFDKQNRTIVIKPLNENSKTENSILGLNQFNQTVIGNQDSNTQSNGNSSQPTYTSSGSNPPLVSYPQPESNQSTFTSSGSNPPSVSYPQPGPIQPAYTSSESHLSSVSHPQTGPIQPAYTSSGSNPLSNSYPQPGSNQPAYTSSGSNSSLSSFSRPGTYDYNSSGSNPSLSSYPQPGSSNPSTAQFGGSNSAPYVAPFVSDVTPSYNSFPSGLNSRPSFDDPSVVNLRRNWQKPVKSITDLKNIVEEDGSYNFIKTYNDNSYERKRGYFKDVNGVKVFVVEGEYSRVLPNGNMLIVAYISDERGHIIHTKIKRPSYAAFGGFGGPEFAVGAAAAGGTEFGISNKAINVLLG